MTRVEFTIRSYMLRDGRFIDVAHKTLGLPKTWRIARWTCASP